MSLIQEALKRQQADGGGKGRSGGAAVPPPAPGAAGDDPALGPKPLKLKIPKLFDTPEDASAQSVDQADADDMESNDVADQLGAAPVTAEQASSESVPPPLPQQPAATDGKMKSKKMLMIGGGALAGVVVLGAVAWFAVGALSSTEEKSAPSAEEAKPQPKPSAQKPAKPDSTRPAPNAGAPTVSKPVPPLGKPSILPKPPTEAIKSPEKTTGGSPSVNQQKRTMWPILVLKGLLGAGGRGKGTAIINDEIVDVGQEIEGVKLIAVNRDNSVTLEYKGEQRILRTGEITN